MENFLTFTTSLSVIHLQLQDILALFYLFSISTFLLLVKQIAVESLRIVWTSFTAALHQECQISAKQVLISFSPPLQNTEFGTCSRIRPRHHLELLVAPINFNQISNYRPRFLVMFVPFPQNKTHNSYAESKSYVASRKIFLLRTRKRIALSRSI